MNAGASATGQAFAVKNCDAFFFQASRTSLDETAQSAQKARDAASAQGRDIGCYTVGVITCRPTKKEAEEYFHHCIVEHADWSAVDDILALRKMSPETVGMEKFLTLPQPICPGQWRPADRRRSGSRRAAARRPVARRPHRHRGVAGELLRRAAVFRRRGDRAPGAHGTQGEGEGVATACSRSACRACGCRRGR